MRDKERERERAKEERCGWISSAPPKVACSPTNHQTKSHHYRNYSGNWPTWIYQIIFTEVYDQLIIADLKSDSIMGILTLQTPCRLTLLPLISNLHTSADHKGTPKRKREKKAILQSINHTVEVVLQLVRSSRRQEDQRNTDRPVLLSSELPQGSL